MLSKSGYTVATWSHKNRQLIILCEILLCSQHVAKATDWVATWNHLAVKN